MSSFTTSVTEKNIRLDDAAFFAFAASARGRHTAWLREIGAEHEKKSKNPKFTFRYFLGTKVVGYETNPELHVVLKAIEAHMLPTKKRELGVVQLKGETDDLPRTIHLDYFNGTLQFIYPTWTSLDLSSVALDIPERKRARFEPGISYMLATYPKQGQGDTFVVGVSGTMLYVGRPEWAGTGTTKRHGSRAAALGALTDLVESSEARGYVLEETDPLAYVRRKNSGWKFG
jgi:hypothetical protein